MKRKTDKITINKKSKDRSWNIFINVFVIILFGGAFIWIGTSIYLDAKSTSNTEDAYLLSLPNLGDTISHSKVCMVDDLYLGKGDFPIYPVSIAGNTYYGCSLEATKKLSSDLKERLSEDPVSKRKIDKATAIITLHPNRDGKIIYFESNETYNSFIQSLKNHEPK